jgi:hypothetical protein
MLRTSRQRTVGSLKRVTLWALATVLCAVPVLAQKGAPSGGAGGTRGSGGTGGTGGTGSTGGSGGTRGSGGTGVPTGPGGWPTRGTGPGIDNSQPGVFLPTVEPIPQPTVVEDESCLPWDVPDMRGATVSAMRLGVPSKARSEYEKACGAFKRKKLSEAEQHVRGAIDKYPKYLAAYVMLGQVLQDEDKLTEAHEACTKALTTDPTYLPPYLCLAGLLDRQNHWADLLTLSGQFMGMNPVGDRYSHYFSAVAHFHLYNLPEAQKNIIQAIALDTEHHQPSLYFLLAQIYGEQGDVADAQAQIRLFLKYSNVRQDKDAAKQYLATLQSEQNTK